MPRGIPAGSLSERVTVQIVTRRKDAGNAGDPTETWDDLFTDWAAFKPISGSDQFRSGQRLTLETAIFTMRQRRDWTPDATQHRLVYRGKNWSIIYPAEIGPRVGWEITAEVRGEGS